MICVLIAILLACHYLADFTPLSTPWMLAAKRLGRPLEPIMTHAMVHAMLCFPWLMLFSPQTNEGGWRLMFTWSLVGVSHFVIDTLKGRLNGWYPPAADPAGKVHWPVFGFDQLLHQLVLVAAAVLVCGWR